MIGRTVCCIRSLNKIIVPISNPARFCSSAPRQDQITHFGYEQVSYEDKEKKVYEVFHNVANKYDLMNDLMSLGIHRCWKDIMMERLGPTPDTHLLDVAGGTGDIAFRFLNYLSPSNKHKVTVCDINDNMLRVGKERAQQQGYSDETIQWIQGNAEELPFDDNSFSAYTIAFGIRNVPRIDRALDEAYRVLKPGGRFLCLEFSRVDNEAIRKIYDLYSFQVIPAMGQIVSGDWKSYQYLVESIRQFPPQEDFKKMIQSAGFWNVTYENMTFGVVSLHSGFKL